jgi:hypothetical protein
MSRCFSRPFAVVCALAALVAATSTAFAAPRAYSSRGTAHFVSPTEFVGSGEATHLGRYTETGTVSFSPTADPNVLHVEGTITYTASNGDELGATVSGELDQTTGALAAAVTYVGGTGRFVAASGSATLTGQVAQTISVAVVGTINF